MITATPGSRAGHPEPDQEKKRGNQQVQVVTIYHNVERDDEGHLAGFFGYEPGHKVTPVFVYADEVEDPRDPRAIAEHAYEMFNIPAEMARPEDLPVIRRYRAARVRSLSVGDIVQVGQIYLACDPVGFRELGSELALNVRPMPADLDNFADTEE